MRDLPRSAQAYIYIVVGLSALVIGTSLTALVNDPFLILPTLILAGVIAALDLIPVNYPEHHTEVVASTGVKLAAVLMQPPAVVLLSTFLGTIISEKIIKRPPFRAFFNAGAMTVTYTVIVLVYAWSHQSGPGILGSPINVLAVGLVGLSEVVVNTLVVALVISLAYRQQISSVLSQAYKPILLNEGTMLPIGVFIALLWDQHTPLAFILAVPPLLLAREAYKMVLQLETQTRDALMALARVLDERDELTSHHCETVSRYSELIAREMKLADTEIKVIGRAAWLHDIGKVGMRNDILFKPGSLTEEERAHAKLHAATGGDLLKKFPLFERGAAYVRNHHEWFDGTGYPDHLKGEEIPLGARILAVADAFEAMTDIRPYRKPLSVEAALLELYSCAGTQFDPAVVQAFYRAQGVPYPEPEIVLAAQLSARVGTAPAE